MYFSKMIKKLPIDRMLKCMADKKMRDVDMYTKLGITKQRFGGWKSRSSIPKDMLASVSKILGLNLAWLIIGEGEKYTRQSYFDAENKTSKQGFVDHKEKADLMRPTVQSLGLLFRHAGSELSEIYNAASLEERPRVEERIRELLFLEKTTASKIMKTAKVHQVQGAPSPDNLSQQEIEVVRCMRDMGDARRDCLHAIARDSAHAARDEQNAAVKTKQA